jgi:signal transduction histidine kinase
LIEAIFVTLFMGISLFFTSSFKRRNEANLLFHLKNIYSYSSDILLLLDKEGMLLKNSDSFSAAFKLNKSEMNSFNISDIIAPELRDTFLEKWGRVDLGKSASAILKPNLQYLRNKDINKIHFVFSPIFEENMLSMVSVVGKLEMKEAKREQGKKNLTDRKSMDAELEQFLSLTSHELQSPMIVLEGYVSALSHAIKDMDLPPEVKEYPKFIIKSVKKVSELIQAILNLSRAGSNKTQMTAVDLNQVFSQVEGEIVQQFSSGSYKLKIEKNLPLVKGDKIQLAQLFINLIKNSIKYASVDRKPEIGIGVDVQDKSSVTLFVKDNGIGMASNDLDSIFSPMQRLHKKEVEGYGLGLTLVKKTADAHGATIKVESKENVGSTFFIKLKKYQHK